MLLLQEVSKKMSHLPCVREGSEQIKFSTLQYFTYFIISSYFAHFQGISNSVFPVTNNYSNCVFCFFLNKGEHHP